MQSELGPTWKQMLKLEGITEGIRKCLRCDREFHSIDIKGNRLCKECRSVNMHKHFVFYQVGGKNEQRGKR